MGDHVLLSLAVNSMSEQKVDSMPLLGGATFDLSNGSESTLLLSSWLALDCKR
jgi:hypothetical protein